MWRRRVTCATAAALALGLAASPARAGVLGKVVDGLSDQSDNDDASSGGGGSNGGDDSGDRRGDSSSDTSSWGTSSSGGGGGTYYYGGGGGGYYTPLPPGGGGRTDLYLYVGAQSVDDSNGAVMLELRATYDGFGFGVRDNSYFEQAGPNPEDYIRLDLWAVGAEYRAMRDDQLQVWLIGGMGGVDTENELSLYGAQIGVRLERRLGGEMAASASGRRFWLEDDITATELQGSIHASILRISYRVLDFNVGPPLKGPEIGVAFTF